MYHHTAIPVVDLNHSQTFYEKLGFAKLHVWNKPQEELMAVVLEKDGFILELVHHPSHQVLAQPAIIESKHVGITVAKLASLLHELERDETPILKPITKGVSVEEFCFIADPSGNVVELVVEKT